MSPGTPCLWQRCKSAQLTWEHRTEPGTSFAVLACIGKSFVWLVDGNHDRKVVNLHLDIMDSAHDSPISQ